MVLNYTATGLNQSIINRMFPVYKNVGNIFNCILMVGSFLRKVYSWEEFENEFLFVLENFGYVVLIGFPFLFVDQALHNHVFQ